MSAKRGLCPFAERDLGMEAGESDDERHAAFDALRRALKLNAGEPIGFASLAKFLAGAPSRLLVISVEDPLDVREQINVPGTIDEYPNWRHRLPVELEDLRSHPGVMRISEIMRSAGRSSSSG